jgi:hypothetical protein
VREALLRRMPPARIDGLPLHRGAGEALHPRIELADPARLGEWLSMALLVDPCSATELSRRITEIWPLNCQNQMALIYRLHQSLALGEIDLLLLGVAARVWTLDGFVRWWLTLPRGSVRRARSQFGWSVLMWLSHWPLRRSAGMLDRADRGLQTGHRTAGARWRPALTLRRSS